MQNSASPLTNEAFQMRGCEKIISIHFEELANLEQDFNRIRSHFSNHPGSSSTSNEVKDMSNVVYLTKE